jgi:hypothetical protein
MVLLEHSSRFLKTVLQPLGCFQFLKVLGPLALPVQGQAAQGQYGNTQTEQATISHPVQVAQPRGLFVGTPGRQRSLDQLQGASGRSPLTLLGLLQRCGDHGCVDELRK